MSDIEFKQLDDEDDILSSTKQLDALNKELEDIKNLIKVLNKSAVDNQAPIIKELEQDLLQLKKDVETAKKDLEKSDEEVHRRRMVVVSGGLGSIAGGTLGMVLVPLSGPLTPLITTVLGGVSGVLYSLF